MTDKKYVLVPGGRMGLYRVKALRDFADVKAGDIGGMVEGEDNLSHEGDAWVYDEALVAGRGRVEGNAKVRGQASVITDREWRGRAAMVYGNAVVKDSATVRKGGRVHGHALVQDNGAVTGNAELSGTAVVRDHARAQGNVVFTEMVLSGNERRNAMPNYGG